LRDIVQIPKGEPGFDIDLVEADVEPLIRNIITSLGKTEIKHDFKVSESQNIAIEYECYGKPSGISITEATYWLIILDGQEYRGQVSILIEVERLKTIARGCKSVPGGDRMAARMYLVPIYRLLRPYINRAA